MKPRIAQYQSTFLKLTEHWISIQLRALEDLAPLVLTKRARNRHLFTGWPVCSLDEQNWLARQYNRLSWHAVGYAPIFRAFCKSHNVRALHAWFGYSGVALLGLARELDVPLITSFLGSDLTRGDRSALAQRYERLFQNGALFLVEGPSALQKLLDLGCPASKARVARLAVDTTAIPERPRVRLAGEPLRVLMAARFTEKKGLPFGVEAFCRFVTGGAAARLIVVGDGEDEEGKLIASELRRIVASYGCEEVVEFAGWQSSAALLQLALQSHIFLHPSVTASNGDAEGGHPVILTELAASGMPIITTNHCDIPEIVVHNANGWVVAERDVAALHAALQDADEHPDKVERFGATGRRLAVAKYDIAGNSLDRWYAAALRNDSS